MPWPVHPTGFFGARGDSDTYRIERSLRFNSADSAYLTWTPSGSGNRTAWTQSLWVKRSKLGTEQHLFESGGANYQIFFATDDGLRWYENGTYIAITSQVFRDTSSWYHLVFTWDSANATAGDRFRIYVNGTRVTSFSSTSNPGPSQSSGWNQASTAHYLGRYNASSLYYFDGYITEANVIDGQALTPSSFGETDAITGRWKAKAYSGTYGTNGFYLKFADNSGTTDTTLGKDSSGNGNNWTPNNFSVTAGAGNDSLVDSPTNYGSDSGLGGEVRGNYCTLNRLSNRSGTLANGNLDLTTSATQNATEATFQLLSGKWYFEYSGNSTSPAYAEVGISTSGSELYSTGCGFYSNVLRFNNATIKSGLSISTTDIIQFAYDGDTGKTWCGVNNTWYDSSGGTTGNPSAGTGQSGTLASGNWFPSIWTVNSGGTISANFGQRPFVYTAPSGFKALCTQNLHQPTIQKPSTAMDVVTYTGTGASQSISSLGFSPDLVWIKGRSGATDHALYDIIRGSQARLESNTTDAEVTSDNGLTAFDSAGFTIGTLAQVNTNTATYVGWSWDAGSTNSTNTSGSITSTVRANPQAGFSIVSYTGTGANATVGHGLGVAPKMVIVKRRDAGSSAWSTYYHTLTAGYILSLNSTSGQFSSPLRFTTTLPTSSVFSIGTDSDLNASSGTYIAYCFSEIEGYSKFGSYTGNGSADGPFVWCGFRPRWVMIKRSDSTSNWELFDTAREPNNVMVKELYPNLADVENASSSDEFDIISNGFKPRSTNTIHNASGGTYIFAAFAEAPFKYARAR